MVSYPERSYQQKGTLMKTKLITLLCSSLLAACCMAFAGCSSSQSAQDETASGEAADATSEETGEAGTEATADSESETANARTDKFLGDWQAAGYEANGITMTGEMNWPRYRAAESRGITVVAEFLPPLMLAMVFK